MSLGLPLFFLKGETNCPFVSVLTLSLTELIYWLGSCTLDGQLGFPRSMRQKRGKISISGETGGLEYCMEREVNLTVNI